VDRLAGRVSAQAWDAQRYDAGFGFVSGYGAELVDVLDPRPGERVLDLGCGTGTLLAEIVRRGARGIGIDADAAMVAAARTNVPDAEILRADGHAFELGEPVDAVFSNAALHWMLRPENVAARVRAALEPGGRFVAELGGARNNERVLAAVRAALAERGEELVLPWYFPTPAQHAAVLERAGFRVARMEHFARPTPLDPEAGGLAGWLRMFGAGLFAQVPVDEVEPLVARAQELARPQLERDGVWTIDYWRLRFVALAEPAA
jgi:SAM-dependent methyltransferase